jgi:hypothetical protein
VSYPTEAAAVCPECGAVWLASQTCQALFDEFLTWEFQDAGYGAVHFLTVATFMTQHGRYSEAGQAWINQKLREHLDEGVGVEWIRESVKQSVSQANRKWKVLREPGDPPAPRRAWDMTIVDVNRRHDEAGLDAAAYRAAVTDWARATLRQLEAEA